MRGRYRRNVPGLGGALLGLLVCVASASAAAEVWRFNRLPLRGSTHGRGDGAPQLIDTSAGHVVLFDGIDDSLAIDRHPLAKARTFTIEAIFRPDGGTFAQRWLHLAELPPVLDSSPGSAVGATAVAHTPRIMFEIRVVGQNWYLDSFMTGPGYGHTLVDAAKLHPIGRWYHVAQTYDGTTYRSYVDGILENEFAMPFTPQGRGVASIGARLNHVDYFHGAIYSARFTRRALKPNAFARLPRRLRPSTGGADR